MSTIDDLVIFFAFESLIFGDGISAFAVSTIAIVEYFSLLLRYEHKTNSLGELLTSYSFFL